ncbi:MAG TPA: branched-chain amino acid ABC transporter permease [Fimbriimonadaceae bacterium]|mgnify:CR=1 FL=1|nr:branched-chain amino acid ABC transporter permease [Fimbriimonadaceae bacterium]
MDWGQLPQYLVLGVQLGAVYALIALGYTMVYGVLRLINFAHGDVFMIGAYLAYYTSMVWFDRHAINPYLMLGMMLLMAMIGCAVLGVVIERLAYRPLRSAPRISVLITAVGVSLFIEYAGRLVVQTSPQPSIVQEVNVLAKPMNIWGINVEQSQIAVLAVVLVLMGLLFFYVTRTSMGRAMRAVSHDFNTASLMGVNVDRVVVVTFIIGSALAGAGGMLQATSFGSPLNTFYGLLPGVKAFVAAVLGGIGNIPGAVVGGLIMGVAETAVVWAGYAGYKDAVAFVILIVILLFRPGGLFGSTAEKV